MASVSDELTAKFFDAAPDKALKAAGVTKQALKDAKDTAVGAGKGLFSGVALVFKGGKFTADAVMSKVGNMMANKNGMVEHAKNSISMADLYSKGKVTRLDDTISKDVMKYFNRHCDETGIKYSVMKESGTDNYYVFFKSGELDAVKTLIQESYKDYLNERKQQGRKEPGQEKEGDHKKKDSVLDRLKSLKEQTREKENKEDPERNHNRADRSR